MAASSPEECASSALLAHMRAQYCGPIRKLLLSPLLQGDRMATLRTRLQGALNSARLSVD